MIRLRKLRCCFGTTVAVDGVSLDIPAGRVLGLLGENGAGKSTLMNLLYGLVRPNSGEMTVDDRRYAPRGPRDALRRGIGMVHQHFMLVPTLTVAQNVVLGMRRAPWIERRQLNDEIARFADSVSLPINPAALTGGLSVGERQRIEILKALYRRVRILILDEPTAVLTPGECEELFRAVRKLRARGVTIVFISHRLKEVVGECDDVAVLRRGRLVHSGIAADATPASLAALMVGQPVIRAERARRDAAVADIAAELRDVALGGTCRNELAVRRGEIMGIAGVDGNGQEALAGALTGLAPPAAGAVCIAGRPVRDAPPARLRRMGVAHIPNDRQREGLALDLSVVENAVLTQHSQPPFARYGWTRRAARAAATREIASAYDVRGPSIDAPAATLSGGNQQKLVVGRELSTTPILIVAQNPTRGVDVAAADFIRSQLASAADRGAGVLLISSDLDEIVEMSDRIAVLYGGRLTMTRWPNCDIDTIARLMAGLGGTT